MTKKLLLHIGTHKTGTTSLQAFAWANAEKLSSRGIAYPRLSKYPKVHRDRNGFVLTALARFVSRPRERTEELERMAKKDFEELKGIVASYDTVLLSDERLWFEGAWSKSFWVELARLIDELGFEEVKLVVYLRRQDQYGASLWKQFVKSYEYLTMEEYFAKKGVSRSMRYRTTLAWIEEVFGEGSVVARPFDRACFAGGDLYHDFWAALGLDWQEGFIIPERELNENLTDTTAMLKRWINESDDYRKSRNPLRDAALSAAVLDKSHSGTTLFTPEFYQELIDAHKSDNEYVAQRYLGEQGTCLITWPELDKPKWEYLSEDTLRATVQLFAAALLEQDNKLAEQSETIAALEKRIEGLESKGPRKLASKAKRRLSR